jgi:hypothetical protein
METNMEAFANGTRKIGFWSVKSRVLAFLQREYFSSYHSYDCCCLPFFFLFIGLTTTKMTMMMMMTTMVVVVVVVMTMMVFSVGG